MNYEINVSLNKRHLFTTFERSITSRKKLEELCTLFKEKFPDSQGYTVRVTQWNRVGTIMSFSGVTQRKLKSEKGQTP